MRGEGIVCEREILTMTPDLTFEFAETATAFALTSQRGTKISSALPNILPEPRQHTIIQ